MKCKEFENGRECPWIDTPEFTNSWCDTCPSNISESTQVPTYKVEYIDENEEGWDDPNVTWR